MRSITPFINNKRDLQTLNYYLQVTFKAKLLLLLKSLCLQIETE